MQKLQVKADETGALLHVGYFVPVSMWSDGGRTAQEFRECFGKTAPEICGATRVFTRAAQENVRT